MSYVRLYFLSQFYGLITFFVMPAIVKAIKARRDVTDKSARVAGYAAATAVGTAVSIVLYEKYGIVYEDTGSFTYGAKSAK